MEAGPAVSSHHQRLLWQCRRGMLELDILLQGFVEHGYEKLSDAERNSFDRLLKYPDQQLIEFFLQQTEPDDMEIARLVESIREAVTV